MSEIFILEIEKNKWEKNIENLDKAFFLSSVVYCQLYLQTLVSGN